MKEVQALITWFVVVLSSVVAAWIGLSLVGAAGGVYVAVVLAISCIASFGISAIVLRYNPPAQGRRRRSHNPPASG